MSSPCTRSPAKTCADVVIEGAKEHRAAADLVGQRRDPELNALAGIALRLPVQRLVLPIPILNTEVA